MRPPLDVDPHFAACVRQILREDAEQAAWEAKIDRRRQMESRGLLFGAWLVGAVLFGAGVLSGVAVLVIASLIVASSSNFVEDFSQTLFSRVQHEISNVQVLHLNIQLVHCSNSWTEEHFKFMKQLCNAKQT